MFSSLNLIVLSLCSPSFIQNDGSAVDWNGMYLTISSGILSGLEGDR